MSDCSSNAIGKRIAKYRKQYRLNGKRLSQESFGKQIGYSREQVAKWETGVQPLQPEQLDKIASFFGITIDKLVTDTDSDNRSVAEITGLSDASIEFLKTVNSYYYVPFTDTDDDELDATSVYHWVDSDTDTNDYVGIEGAYPGELNLAINTLLSKPIGQQLIGMIAKFISIDFGQSYIHNELCFDVEYNNEDTKRKKTTLPLTLMRYALLQAICSKLEEIKKDLWEGAAE